MTKTEAGIVERLRFQAEPLTLRPSHDLMLQAASLIERQSRALVEAREALNKVRAGYASQQNFADPEPAAYYREFIRHIDKILATITAALTEKDGE